MLVARIVHFLRLHLVGKKIATASAIDDSNVFGKVGTTGEAVETALKGKKVRKTCIVAGGFINLSVVQVVSAGNQGKYFW